MCFCFGKSFSIHWLIMLTEKLYDDLRVCKWLYLDSLGFLEKDKLQGEQSELSRVIWCYISRIFIFQLATNNHCQAKCEADMDKVGYWRSWGSSLCFISLHNLKMCVTYYTFVNCRFFTEPFGSSEPLNMKGMVLGGKRKLLQMSCVLGYPVCSVSTICSYNAGGCGVLSELVRFCSSPQEVDWK